jgi:hypothetical protein
MIRKQQGCTRREILALAGLALGVGGLASVTEAGEEHPRIRAAIAELQNAREYLLAAPHNFGGHRAKAVEVIGEAIRQLKICLKC